LPSRDNSDDSVRRLHELGFGRRRDNVGTE